MNVDFSLRYTLTMETKEEIMTLFNILLLSWLTFQLWLFHIRSFFLATCNVKPILHSPFCIIHGVWVEKRHTHTPHILLSSPFFLSRIIINIFCHAERMSTIIICEWIFFLFSHIRVYTFIVYYHNTIKNVLWIRSERKDRKKEGGGGVNSNNNKDNMEEKRIKSSKESVN